MTSSDLNRQRRDFAVAREDAAYHFLALAREQRGQPWDKNLDSRATHEEREYGIGYRETAERQKFAENARAMRSGFCFPVSR